MRAAWSLAVLASVAAAGDIAIFGSCHGFLSGEELARSLESAAHALQPFAPESRVGVLGNSSQGRPIWALCAGLCNDGSPSALYIGAMHSREVSASCRPASAPPPFTVLLPRS